MKCQHVTAQSAKKWITTKAWPLIRWERGRPRPIVIATYKRKLKCARSTSHRTSIRKAWKAAKREFREHRKAKLAEQERLRYLPYDCGGGVRSAIPCSIMWCESGGSYTVQNAGGSGARGKYQFMPSTYAAWCRTCDWSPADQDQAAYRLYASAGGAPWVCA